MYQDIERFQERNQQHSLHKKALTAALKAKDLVDEEVESKVETILAVIES